MISYKTACFSLFLFVSSLSISAAINDQEQALDAQNIQDKNKESKILNKLEEVCSYYGFGKDAYSYFFCLDSKNEEAHKEEIAHRFKRAKSCLKVGTIFLLSGAATSLATVGSLNPWTLEHLDSSEQCREEHNKNLTYLLTNTNIYYPTRLAETKNYYNQTCEERPFISDDLYAATEPSSVEGFSRYGATFMMINGCLHTLGGLTHLCAGIVGKCIIGHNACKKIEDKKAD